MRLQAYGASDSAPIKPKPWRYDVALNSMVLNLIDHADVLIRCDSNESLPEDWQRLVAQAWTPGTTRMMVSIKQDARQWLEPRVHLASGYTWRRRIHPVLDTMMVEQVAVCTDLVIEQHSSMAFSNYDQLLDDSAKEWPMDTELIWRQAHQRAKQSYWGDAIDLHKKHLTLSNDEIFRSDSMISLSGLNPIERFSWIMRAVAETPYRREPWYELMRYHYDLGEWAACYGAGLRGLAITAPLLHETDNPRAWAAEPFDFAAISAWNLGLTAQALAFAERAVEIDPRDLRLQNNLAAIRSGQ